MELGLKQRRKDEKMETYNEEVDMNLLIKEINALAQKKKAEGLTEEEQTKQDALRKKYLEIFRGNFKSQLEHTKIQTPDGQLHPLKYMPANDKS